MLIRKILEKTLAERALLVGRDVEGKCVYTAFLPLEGYYDAEHPWDNAKTIKRLRLRTVRGYLFDEKGGVEQEFESTFDCTAGTYESGWCRQKDGTLTT
jgi:hypothetical protein